MVDPNGVSSKNSVFHVDISATNDANMTVQVEVIHFEERAICKGQKKLFLRFCNLRSKNTYLITTLIFTLLEKY